MKTPDYLSYERYKKRKEVNPSKRFYLFVATFFVTLLVFTVFVKLMTPDVDVSIGGDTEIEAKDTGLGVKRFIDERLKLIQMEDNSAGVSTQVERKDNLRTQEEKYNNDDDYNEKIIEENIKLPETKNTHYEKEEPVMPAYAEPKSVAPRPQQHSTQQTSSANTYTNTSVSKVYVGKYATLEQARVAQEILMDAGVVSAPFIKSINGSYTIQAGSFTSKAKAEELAVSLKHNGFPARIEQE